jgi:CRISPR-associated protein Csb2
MTPRVLLIEVGLLEDRWHGVGDWPPSPFRLFQAMVAGAYGGRWVAEDPADKDAAFRWLERQSPPKIAAPPRARTQPFTYFVPNNDLDALGGDPRRVAEIRSAKVSAPVMLESGTAFLFAWTFAEGGTDAERLCELSERLHTFGRGIDAAFARGEVLDQDTAEARLISHGGVVSRPSGGHGVLTPCPTEGSLDSLKVRHAETASRFQTQMSGRKTATLFRQASKAQARSIAYDRPPAWLHFELRCGEDLQLFRPISQDQVVAVAEGVRDGAAKRLLAVMPSSASLIERFLIGRGASADDRVRRVRITPMPTIGHPNASPSIRRIMVEVPPDCPMPLRDLAWAFAGLSLDRIDPETGEVVETVLVPTEDLRMAKHYGLDAQARRWRSVTPVALPHPPGRGGTGAQRADTEASAAAALAAALRHAGVERRAVELRIQREPFHAKGQPAETFLTGGQATRFTGRLRHVEVGFDSPVAGPLLIGDGRFVGLGLMRPVREPPPGLHLFAIDPAETVPVHQATVLVHAFRRAVMARAQAVVGERKSLPVFFTGHSDDGDPARSGRHEHLFFLAEDTDGDGRIDRLAVVAPHLADRRMHADRDNLQLLDKTVSGLTILRAGRAGAPRLKLIPLADEVDPVFVSARVWVSRTPYRPTRHPRRGSDVEAGLRLDILTECNRRGLPVPEVDILEQNVGVKGGLTARAGLRFATAVEGPILLGVGSHFGSGLFEAVRA